MPATVQIVEKNGATPVLTDKTSGTVRFKNADNATVDSNTQTSSRSNKQTARRP